MTEAKELNDVAAKPQILIVEDETVFAKAVKKRLTKDGYHCNHCVDLESASTSITQEVPDLILLDMRLPDGSGLDFLARLREGEHANIPVVVMTAYGEIEDAVTAMKLSASDYLKKPVDLDDLSLTVEKVFSNQRLSEQLAYSKTRESNIDNATKLVGDSDVMMVLKGQIEQIAKLSHADGVEPPTVLITGETGTGKDVTAREIHGMSARRDKPFVHVDCASLPKDLIEAELFGHAKGAFTNAHAERIGLIEAAEDGVVFLDEIGEIPLELQSKLLAVLERRMLRRVGSSQERTIDAWFIAATNRDVENMVDEGTLRSDLYFRLNVITMKIPPLRQRGDDIGKLAKHFGVDVARRYGFPEFSLDDNAMQAMMKYAWPGNVRELRHVIERATLLSGGRALNADDLMLANADSPADKSGEGLIDGEINSLAGLTLDEAEVLLIRSALERADQNVSAAARELGITRMAMRYRMKKYGLD